MSSAIKSLVKNIPGVQKINGIKNLILEKLDLILQGIDTLTKNSAENKDYLANLSGEINKQANITLDKLNEANQKADATLHLLSNEIDKKADATLHLLSNEIERKIDATLHLLSNEINKKADASVYILTELNIKADKSIELGEKIDSNLNTSADLSLENQYSLIEAAINTGEYLQETQEANKEQNSLTIDSLRSIYRQIEAVKKEMFDDRVKVIKQKYPPRIEPEKALMAHLYSYLPSRKALDIGANLGDVSAYLLKVGYEVYAFEPYHPVFEKLKDRFHDNSNFHCYQFALGAKDETKDLYLAADLSKDRVYEDASLYNSLTKHSMPEELIFNDTVSVEVKSLDSLHRNKKIPNNIGLVKIDTEGFDLEVIKGMENNFSPVVVAEFWDEKFPFARSGANNKLSDLVLEMKAKNYHWHIVIYRVWGEDKISFYANYSESVEKSWGNVFFFQDYQIFSQGLMWCHSTLPVTYFSV